MRDKTIYTPMMQQYLTIKENYQDAFVFFRMGDFYELFFEDALLAVKELEIALTGRGAGTEERVPMCGVPHHSAENYINKLIEKGYKVAVCEQVEDPEAAKGLVRREVVRLLSPGTIMSQNGLSEKDNNFICALAAQDGEFAVAYCDLSTGENFLLKTDEGQLIGELINLGSREIIISPEIGEARFDNLRALRGILLSQEERMDVPIEHQLLIKEHQDPLFLQAFGRLVNYLSRTQKNHLDHLQPVRLTKNEDALRIDHNSRRNLELTETIRAKTRQGSLLWLLDKTKTAMGSRLLKQWVERPSLAGRIITERHELVEALMADFMIKEELKISLDGVYDLERLAGRVAYGNANARDLLQLQMSLERVPVIKDLLSRLGHPSAVKMGIAMDACEELAAALKTAITEQPPLGIKEGGIFKDGYHQQLDEYRYVITHGKEWILALEAAEREKTGIRSLKIKFNKVFGYYLEISKANLHLLKPEMGYVRKQTLVNAERFITPELKEKEDLILNAEEKSIQLEYELFGQLREIVRQEIPKIQQLARDIAFMDVIQSFAVISEENRYVRPRLNDSGEILIREGRHPVVEKVLKETRYVENDCVMPGDLSMLLITGPNMAGKSTYMRQLALIAIMNQVGCFVPATEASLPVFDQVFTRIGAADDLVSGHSTFMVEMMETNYALENATKDSLILLDEIGRGTATFDGMALAQSIIEHVHDHIGAKTLFSTHYHELTALEDKCLHLENRHVMAEEHDGKLVFLHKVMEGPSDKSYGIHVAQIASLPPTLINRAKELLDSFEAKKEELPKEEILAAAPEETVYEPAAGQLSLFAPQAPAAPIREKIKIEYINPYEELLEKLEAIDVYQLTPMQAMNAMYELKLELGKQQAARS